MLFVVSLFALGVKCVDRINQFISQGKLGHESNSYQFFRHSLFEIAESNFQTNCACKIGANYYRDSVFAVKNVTRFTHFSYGKMSLSM